MLTVVNHVLEIIKILIFSVYLCLSWLIWKDPDAGKDWRQEEKGPMTEEKGPMTEDEMVGWHHRLNGHESE